MRFSPWPCLSGGVIGFASIACSQATSQNVKNNGTTKSAYSATATAQLYDAVHAKDVETVKKLLQQGANPNTKNPRGWPVLCTADESAEITALLLKSGAAV